MYACLYRSEGREGWVRTKAKVARFASEIDPLSHSVQGSDTPVQMLVGFGRRRVEAEFGVYLEPTVDERHCPALISASLLPYHLHPHSFRSALPSLCGRPRR